MANQGSEDSYLAYGFIKNLSQKLALSVGAKSPMTSAKNA